MQHLERRHALQVSVHETPSTSDTLMKVLSAILSMAPAAEAPSSRAGSARTTASPAAPSAGTKVARSPRTGRTATSTSAIAAINMRYSGLCVRHTHRTQNEHPHQAHRAETQKGRGRPSTRPRARLHPGEPAQAGSPGAGHSFASHDAEPPRAHIAPRSQAS